MSSDGDKYFEIRWPIHVYHIDSVLFGSYDNYWIQIIGMQHVQGTVDKILAFIRGSDFFFYHGLVLALLWFFAAPLAILLRKVSRQIHGACFFFIDVTTVFFLVGAGIRVYPHIGNFPQWSIIKQGHIAAGSLFLLLLLVQHVGGVLTLIKGMSSNPAHRKFGIIVSNMGRIIAVFGLILAQQDQRLIIGAATLAFLMFILTVKKLFSSKPKVSDPNQETSTTETGRQRSPPRDVKRD